MKTNDYLKRKIIPYILTNKWSNARFSTTADIFKVQKDCAFLVEWGFDTPFLHAITNYNPELMENMSTFAEDETILFAILDWYKEN